MKHLDNTSCIIQYASIQAFSKRDLHIDRWFGVAKFRSPKEHFRVHTCVHASSSTTYRTELCSYYLAKSTLFWHERKYSGGQPSSRLRGPDAVDTRTRRVISG